VANYFENAILKICHTMNHLFRELKFRPFLILYLIYVLFLFYKKQYKYFCINYNNNMDNNNNNMDNNNKSKFGKKKSGNKFNREKTFVSSEEDILRANKKQENYKKERSVERHERIVAAGLEKDDIK
jgi:hypothetical protein